MSNRVASFFLGAALLLAGCSQRDRVQVRLESLPVGRDLSRLEIRAQVSGPLAGLTYKWVSDSGQCNPQETDQPTTVYVFTDSIKADNVAVEVWSANRRIARNEIEVQRPVKPKKLPLPATPIQIEISQIPPYDPQGGANTRTGISGKVSGPVSTADHKVILYSRAKDVWYIQPGSHSTHEIQVDNTWSGWTHKGASYAAFVVRREYIPVFTLDVLPPIGGDVLARIIVEGKRADEDAEEEEPVLPRIDDSAKTRPAGVASSEEIPNASTTLRVKAGAKTPFIDSHGVVWQADEGFIDGVRADRDVALGIENSTTPELYRSERYDVTRFHCRIPNGKYLVKLHFAEMYAKITKPGQRVFSLRLDGKDYKDIDIFALAGGQRRALVQTLHATVLRGILTITFTRQTQVPFINAIEINPDLETTP